MAVQDYKQDFTDAGNEWNVDPILMMGIGHQESGGNPRIKDSSAGAQGLMQIMPDTGKELGLTDPYDARQSIFAGTKYMRQMLDKYPGRPDVAVMAYNAGPGRMDAAMSGKGGIPQETMAYLPAVDAHYKKFSKIAADTTQPLSKTDLPVENSAPSGSIDDFIKRTTTEDKPGARNDELEAFINRTAPLPPTMKGAPGMPDFVKPSVAASSPVMTYDDQGNPTPEAAMAMSQTSPSRAPGAILDAARRGATDSNLVTPEAETAIGNALRKAGIFPPQQGGGNLLQRGNEAVLGGVGRAANAAPAVLNSLMQGGLETVNQVAGPKAAQVANFAMIDAGARGGARSPYAGPMNVGDTAIGNALIKKIGPSEQVNPVAPEPTTLQRIIAAEKEDAQANSAANVVHPEPPPNAANSNAPNTPKAGINNNALLSDRAANSNVKPGDLPTEPNNPSAPKGSLSAAATPSPIAALKDSTIRAARGDVELRAAMEPAQHGMDTSEYLPGIKNTKAEYSGDPSVSQVERLARERDPSGFKPQIIANNDIVMNAVEHNAGTKTQKDTINQNASADYAEGLAKVWAKKKPLDGEPVVQRINDILDSPVSSNPAVRGAMEDVLKEIERNPQNMTDPEFMHGVRDHINALIEGNAGIDKLPSKRAAAQLKDVRDVVDRQIEAAAPGFKAVLEKYAFDKQPANSMEALQEWYPKLIVKDQFTGGNKIDLRAYTRMMKDFAEERSKPGIDNSKAISDDTMRQLMLIHAELKRFDNINLGKAYGSPTNLNAAWESAKGLGKSVGKAALYGAALGAAGTAGNLLFNAGQDFYTNYQADKNLQSLTREHLAPPPNKLIPPRR